MKNPISSLPRRLLPAAACSGMLVLGVLPGGMVQLYAQDGVAEARTPPPEGVTPQVELGIGRGLAFLVKDKESDGSWMGEGGAYPVAMTALAGVALLSSGST